MQGTGSQTDPFYPVTWSEFLSAVATTGAYVECPDKAVWDMNDLAPGGLPTVNWYAKKVNGNGSCIKNINFRGGYFNFTPATDIEIIKLDYLNFSADQNSMQCFYSGNANTIRFKNCKFSGLIDHGVVFNSYNRMWFVADNEKSCALNLRFSGSGRLTDNAAVWFYCCNIAFDGISTDRGNYTGSIFEKCYISGKNPFSVMNGCGYSNVFDIEIPSGTQLYCYENSHAKSSVVNKSKVHGTYGNYATYMIKCTAEQISDAVYLKSQGFAIA